MSDPFSEGWDVRGGLQRRWLGQVRGQLLIGKRTRHSLEPFADKGRARVDADELGVAGAIVGELVRYPSRDDHDVAGTARDLLLLVLEGEVTLLHDPGLVVGMAVQSRALPGLDSSRISEIDAPWSAPLMFASLRVSALITGIDGSSLCVLLIELTLSVVAGDPGRQQPAVSCDVVPAGLFEHVRTNRTPPVRKVLATCALARISAWLATTPGLRRGASRLQRLSTQS